MWTQQDYELHLQCARELYVKVQLLDWNENVIYEIQGVCLDGSINIDAESIIRRTCNITLAIEDTSLIPSQNNKIWINKKIKIYIGIKDIITNEIIWFNKGIYVLDKPSLRFSVSEKTMSLQGLDKMCILDGTINGKLQNITRVQKDIRMFDAVKEIITNVAMENKYSIDGCKDIVTDEDYIIPYQIEKSETDTIADLLKEIRDLYITEEFYYNEEGRFIWQKIKDRKYDPVMWNFTENNLVIDYANEPDWENVKNDIWVWGRTLQDGTQIKYHLENKNDNQFGSDYIGKRNFVVKEDKLFTQQQAQILAIFII